MDDLGLGLDCLAGRGLCFIWVLWFGGLVVKVGGLRGCPCAQAGFPFIALISRTVVDDRWMDENVSGGGGRIHRTRSSLEGHMRSIYPRRILTSDQLSER